VVAAVSMINLQASYFAFENPLLRLERWFNSYQYRQLVSINQREVEVKWTDRAERKLRQGGDKVIVELQLYFSCVVKKRVLFHNRVEFETVKVNDNIEMAFRPLASKACNPREFAASYPQGKNLSQGVAANMVPRKVEIDYRRGNWEGQFHY